ncbi:hypothetical protein Syun_013046 [Stephania yunnanensis]|uniref:Pentatricopeptide repeat-containing protein n=1 Tax=Stephania yunnanensis TaxID=152371 RepID=A0AAP0K0N0_9MAGN
MRELKQIHAQILLSHNASKQDHHFLITRLLFFCAISQTGCLSYATNLFNLIERPNLYAYNTMIRAFATRIGNGSESSALLYKQMLREGVRPDHLTFTFLAKECARRGDVDVGRIGHAHVVELGFGADLFIGNSLISMYASFGCLGFGRLVFDEMSERNIVSWNSLIIGYLRCGCLDSAQDLFMGMGERNVISWNSIITGFVQGGQAMEALGFFHQMQVLGEDLIDKVTVASVLSACASLGALDQGKWVHSYMERRGVECDMVIGTALVDMYGKCGCLERAIEVFMGMEEKDVLAWTAMIAVFALHGLGDKAFDLFEEMQAEGIKPNHVTFLGLLSACAHSGLVEKARWCFNTMKHVYLIEPQIYHYACMVDILGRAGLFDEAEKLIASMPMEPDVFVWGALLGSCWMHGNVELGERIAFRVIESEPLNHAFYVILSDLYAKANRFDDMKRVRTSMAEKGIRKAVAGCSMIEVNGIVHEFFVQGSPGATMKEIEWVLNNFGYEL